MNQYLFKIYVPSEDETIESISEKFNIDINNLYLFNPLLKGKVKIANMPIKIPYIKKEETITRNTFPNQNIIHEELYILKTIILYKVSFNINQNFLINYINKRVSSLNNSINKNNHFIYLDLLYKFIDQYNSLTQETYLEYIKQLEDIYCQIEDNSLNQTILLYISRLKEENYLLGEEEFIKKMA